MDTVRRESPDAEVPAGEPTATLEHLEGKAHGKAGKIPVSLLARYVLAVTPEADLPVREAALEAILRRLGFAHRDGLRVTERPPRGVLGMYATGHGRRASRPYRTWLRSVAPLSGSCNCADFLRNSLGVCKHLLAVVEDLAGRPRPWQRALASEPATPAMAHLSWDPVRPLRGRGDALARLCLVGLAAGRLPSIARYFETDGRLARVLAEDPGARLALVRRLAAWNRKHEVEPAVAALLARESEELSRTIDGAVPEAALQRALAGLKLPLYPYQLEGVRRVLEAGRFLLADDMGLGKTAQAIAVCHVLRALRRVKKGLLVVPASLRPQWEREWRNFTDAPLEVVDGGRAEREAAYRELREGFLVVSYEGLVRDLPAIQRLAPDLVVLDEAQRIKNWFTKTAASVKALSPRYRLVLTGTPLENRLEELASIVEWVDDMALEPKWRLGPGHAMLEDFGSGARNLETLRERLAPAMLRRVRQEVLAQLPPRTDTQVSVALTAEQEGEHAALDPSISALLHRAARRPLTQAEFLRLMSLLTEQRVICNGLALYRFGETWPALKDRRPSEALLKGLAAPKLLELRELVANLVVTQERKVVIFSQWVRMLRLAGWAISDLLADLGLRAVFFTGEQGGRRRAQNLVDFHDDPRTRVLFCSDAGGVGLNLQGAASAMINLELPWNPAVLEQRIGRIYRLGQREPVEVYHLVSSAGIESRIARLVGDKKALFDSLFEGTTDQVRFERSHSFLSRIERLVDAPAIATAEDEDEADDLAVAEGSRVAEPEGGGAEGPVAAEAAPVTPVASSLEELRDPTPGEVAGLLGKLEVRRTDGGGLAIEAPPEAAASLAALFAGMARLLSGAAAAAGSSEFESPREPARTRDVRGVGFPKG
jgi:hypothetical protein